MPNNGNRGAPTPPSTCGANSRANSNDTWLPDSQSMGGYRVARRRRFPDRPLFRGPEILSADVAHAHWNRSTATRALRTAANRAVFFPRATGLRASHRIAGHAVSAACLERAWSDFVWTGDLLCGGREALAPGLGACARS